MTVLLSYTSARHSLMRLAISEYKEWYRIICSPWMLVGVTAYFVPHAAFAPLVMWKSRSPSICSYMQLYKPYQSLVVIMYAPMLSYFIMTASQAETAAAFDHARRLWMRDSSSSSSSMNIVVEKKKKMRSSSVLCSCHMLLRRMYYVNAYLIRATAVACAISTCGLTMIPRILFDGHQPMVHIASAGYFILQVQMEMLQQSRMSVRFLILMYACLCMFVHYLDDCLCNMYFFAELAAFSCVGVYFVARLTTMDKGTRFNLCDYAMYAIPTTLIIWYVQQRLIHEAVSAGLHLEGRNDATNEPLPTLFGRYDDSGQGGYFLLAVMLAIVVAVVVVAGVVVAVVLLNAKDEDDDDDDDDNDDMDR